jgi:SAM-dependent methyltransferase
MSETAYDRIGHGYSTVRRSDPRIAARVEIALGDASSVLNVGAGTGSYEPTDREVTAVEPSEVMISQRPPGAAPVVKANAEELPFDDDSFEAAMAMITVHHWRDLAAGVREMRRVARQRVVVLSFDPAPLAGFWFCDYFPQALEIHSDFMPPIDELSALLGGAEIETVPLPRRCSDGFFFALWDRPELHLDPEVRRASTIWHVMAPEEIERGLAALHDDLDSGRWDERHGHLRDETLELDLGLRLLVAELPG